MEAIVKPTEKRIRVLVVISSALTQVRNNKIIKFRRLNVDKIRRRLRSVFQNTGVSIEVQFLSHGTYGNVHYALQHEPGFDIVLLVLHGLADGRLLFEDTHGGSNPQTPQQFVNLFPLLTEKLCCPRLVVLTDCHSDYAGKALADTGKMEVISIDSHFEVLEKAAEAYEKMFFYTLLANGSTVSEAHETGKHAVAAQEYSEEEHKWFKNHGLDSTTHSEHFKLRTSGVTTFGQRIRAGKYFEIPAKLVLNNIPTRLKDEELIGREQEIVLINSGLDANPVVIMHGQPIVGKTSLVYEVARWHIERHCFDAVIWHSCEGGLKSLATTINGVLKVQNVNLIPQNISILLILDGFDCLNYAAQRKIINFILPLPQHSKVLITSRVLLNLLNTAKVVSLEGIKNHQDCFALFALFLGISTADAWTKQAIIEICVKRLGKNPGLIIEVARNLRLWHITPQKHLEEHPAEQIHPPDEGFLDQSLKKLSIDAQKFLLRLSLFAGGGSTNAIDTLFGTDFPKWRKKEMVELDVIINKEGENDNLRLYITEPWRQDSRNRFGTQNKKAFEKLNFRFAKYYIRYAKKNKASPPNIKMEQANIEAAIQWCHVHRKWKNKPVGAGFVNVDKELQFIEKLGKSEKLRKAIFFKIPLITISVALVLLAVVYAWAWFNIRPPEKMLTLDEIDGLPVETKINGIYNTADPLMPYANATSASRQYFREYATGASKFPLLREFPHTVNQYLDRGNRFPWIWWSSEEGDAPRALKIDYRCFTTVSPAPVPQFVTLEVQRKNRFSYIGIYIITDALTPWFTPMVLSKNTEYGERPGLLKRMISGGLSTESVDIEIGWGSIRSYYLGGNPSRTLEYGSDQFPNINWKVVQVDSNGISQMKQENIAHRWGIEYVQTRQYGSGTVVGPRAFVCAVEFLKGRPVSRSPWVYLSRRGIIDVDDTWSINNEDSGNIIPMVLLGQKKVVFLSNLFNRGQVCVTDFDGSKVIVYEGPDRLQRNLSFDRDAVTADEITDGRIRLQYAGNPTLFNVAQGTFDGIKSKKIDTYTYHRDPK